MNGELLKVSEAAKVVRRHPVTVRKALEARELHGIQRKPGAHWLVHEECALAWIHGEPCPHTETVAPVLPLRIMRAAS